MSYRTEKPLILARKVGKLPGKTISKSYALEYGEASIEIKDEDIQKGDKVVIVDDLIATGGTIEAVIDMVEEKEATVDFVVCLMNLKFLGGSAKINNRKINFLQGVQYDV